MTTNNLRTDHMSLPLLSISKWEGEEGCLAYVKAYMIVNNHKVVRVRYTREGSAWYVYCNTNAIGEHIFSDSDYECEDDMDADVVNHTTKDILLYAKENGLIPEEYDYEADRLSYLESLSVEDRKAYEDSCAKHAAELRKEFAKTLDNIIVGIRPIPCQ